MRWIFGLAIVMVLGVACSSDGGGPNDATETPTATPTIEFAVGTPTAAPTENGVRATVLKSAMGFQHDTSKSLFYVQVRFEPPLEAHTSVAAEVVRAETGDLVAILDRDANVSGFCFPSEAPDVETFTIRGPAAEEFSSEILREPGPRPGGLRLLLRIEGEVPTVLQLELPQPDCVAIE